MAAATARTTVFQFQDAADLARQLTQERDAEERWRAFSRELFVNPSLPVTASVVAQEYRRLTGADRVWVLLPSGGRYRVRAVSGVPGFQRRAEVVRRLEQLVARSCRSRQEFNWTAGEESEVPRRLEGLLAAYLDEAHVAQLQVDMSFGSKRQKETDLPHLPMLPTAVIVAENFQPREASIPEPLRKDAVAQAGLALEIASDWSRAPLALGLRDWRRKTSLRRIAGWMLTLVAGGGLAAACALVPIDKTIDAVGELQPLHQRHVFATANGVIDQLAVKTGDQLAAGETILTLEDSELELEYRRVAGELQSTEQRIASLEASRLDFGSATTETATQINSLAGDLSEQLQRRENLQRELELLAYRRRQLQVSSPIAGQVITWDLERLLSRRPVSRGQRLLTVADTQGPWQVELRVADEDTHELAEALQSAQEVRIDYIVVTMPEIVRSTRVKDISGTVEVRSAGEGPTALCRADVAEDLKSFAASGLGVRGRIHCGRKAAIVVGFGKLWRSIQEYVLFPWGF